MAGVKTRLKIFEPETAPNKMASIRPQVALKPPQFGKNLSPALQKFMNKQNEDLEGKTSQDSLAGEVKKSPGVARKGHGTLAKNEENSSSTFSLNKPVAVKPPIGAVKPSEIRRSSQSLVPKVFQQDSWEPSENSNRRGSQVNVPKVFQQDSVNSGESSENNNRRVSVPKVFQQNLAAEILKQNYQSDTNEDRKPKPLVKPSFAHPRPVVGLKPPVSNSETSSSESSTGPSIKKKLSDIKSEDKIEMGLRESSRVKLPGLEQLPLKSSIPSASTNCPPASDGKVTDFRAMLKSTTSHTGNQLAGKDKPTAVVPGVSPSNKSETDSTDKTHVPVSNGSQSIHELKRQSFSSTVTGNRSDSKQYKKVRLEASFHPAPPKPELPGNVDLSVIRQQYLKTLQSFKNSSDPEIEAGAEAEAEENGVIYDDGFSMRSGPRHQSERVSMIPDMTAEEEEEGPMYNDGCTPKSPFQHQRPEADDFYVDAETERKVVDEVVEEDFEMLYEDEETFAVSPEKLEEEKKKRQKEEAEAKKREEKEKKEKEKEEEKKRKKEEKERMKKEKEEMQLRKKFNLTGEEVSVGEGIIKQDVKGGVLGGMSLKKGQTVTIIRLDNNPPNKWLIRTETNIGYVDMSIIEIDPAKIRPAMANITKGAPARKDDDNDQAFYCDVGQDGSPLEQHDDGEIYEEL